MASSPLEIIRTKPEIESERAEFPTNFPDPIDVSAKRYFDPEFYRLEREHVFKKTWQYVGHREELPNEGDYLLLTELEEPVFLVHGKDGNINAFFNVCQHRGSPLVTKPKGNKRVFVCPFHGWTYDQKGGLRGYPEAKNFPRNMGKECLSLKRVKCESFGPLIFINFDPEAISLREYLGPVADEIDPLIGDASEDCHLAGREVFSLRGNWKIAGDANVETYHVPYLHKNTASPLVDSHRTGQWLLPNGHSRMLLKFKNKENAAAPIKRKTFKGLQVNPLPLDGIYSFHLFPNTSIVMAGTDMYFIISAVPTGPSSMKYIVDYLSHIPRGGKHDAMLDQMVKFNSMVLQEDLALVEDMQTAMEQGILTKLKLQYQERRIRRLHEDLDLMIGADKIEADLQAPNLLDNFVEER